MADSSIEWTEKVWNPTRGCDVYSKECTNCYAMRFAHRFAGAGGKYEGLTKLTKGGPVWTGEVRTVPEQLQAPMAWKHGARVFVDSMSDLFYGDDADRERAARRGTAFNPVPFDYIASCFDVMATCQRHTFQILTKRPARAAAFLAIHNRIPLHNVLMGCSVGYQDAADARRESMRAIARMGWRTWVSYEPALWLVDWTGWEFLTWLVAGGESGYGRRPAEVAWFELARGWCELHGVAFFMKQLIAPGGRKVPYASFPIHLQVRNYPVPA